MTPAPAPALVERPQVRGPSSGRVRSGPTSGRKRRRARARAPRVPQLGELLRSAHQRLDQDPLRQPASPPAYNFSQLRIHDDAEEADQRRTELLDPATLGIRMATDVLRSLRGDPEDRSHRVQLQLARIDDPDLSSAVLAKLKVWLPSTEYSRVTGLVAQANTSASPLPPQSQLSPAPVEEPDPLGDQVARDDAAVSDATNRAQLKAEYLPREAQTHAEKATAEAQKSVNAADAEKQKTDRQRAEKRSSDDQRAAEAKSGQSAAAGPEQQDSLAAALRARQTQGTTRQQGQQRAQAPQNLAGGAAMAQGAVMPAVAPAAPVPQSGGAPAAPMTMSAGGTPPINLNVVDALANAPGGPLASHQMRDVPGNTAERQPDQAPPGEEPIGAENTDLAEIDMPEPVLPALPAQQPIPAAAYLPAQDIDVSGVPTADQLKLPESGALPPPPAAPSFPAPPVPAMVAPPPGAQDPEEAQLAAQAAREGATIEPAPGQVGQDAAEAEPDVAPESVAPGPEVMPAEPAAAGPAPASADGGGTAADGGPAAGPATAPGAAGGGALPQDATLEPGGGSSAGGAAPSADALPSGGGPASGGGAPAGGGGSAAPPPQPPVPNVSQQQPETALAVVGKLPVVPLARGLSGVNASVGHSVGKQRDALAKSPPELERPSGAPRTLHGPPPVAPAADYGAEKVQKANAKGPGQQAKPQGKQVAGGPTPADQVSAPKVTGNAKGNVTATDVQHVQQAVNNVPTTDPALDHASVGVAPKVQLNGGADPALTDTQLTNLRGRAARILTTGRDDATRPLGEDEIYPDVPAHEILKASVVKGGASGPAAGAVGGAAVNSGPAGDQAVSAIAQQQRGSQIQSAIAQGQSKMTQGERAKQRQEDQDRQQHHAKIAAAIKKSTDDETAERGKAAVQVRQQRKAWQDQEDKLTSDADTEAGQKHDKARSDIEKKKSDTDTQVAKRQQTDNAQIIAKRKEAEAKARSEQAKKQNQSGGWFGWVCSKVSDAFHDLISAVKGIFDAARRFVQGVIDTFKKFATGLIDAARKWIIANISLFASALLAIGNVLLAAFPALRDKFRKLIIGLRNAAIALVNKVANFLKKAITDLLNLLGKALSALLNVLEQQLLAAIASVQKTVQGVIDFVKSTIMLLGEFAAIVKDVAADPGGWIRKLGAAVMDGVRFFLFGAIVSAVKNWFVQQIQQILGLTQVVKFAAGAVAGGVALVQHGQQWLAQGQQLLSVLLKGGISLPKIIQMAWQALIQALPQILIQLAIEKLVSIIVPAIGGIIQIVQAVIAAYNSIKSIVAAINKFVTFLKAVKAGTAARPFATAVAAGAVALLNFLAQPLLEKVKNLAKKIDGKLQSIAQKILGFLMRGVNAVRKGLGKAFNLAKRGAKAALRGIKRAARAAGRLAKRGLAKVKNLAKRGLRAVVNGVKALGRRLAKTKFGKFLKNIYNKLKTKYQSFKSKLANWRSKFTKWRQDRKKNKPDLQKRLDAAVERIRPRLQGMLKPGVSDRILRLTLLAMRLWYRLTELTIQGQPGFEISAVLNPDEIVLNGNSIPSEGILQYIRDLENDIRAQAASQSRNIITDTTSDPRKREIHEVEEDLDVGIANARLIAVNPAKGRFKPQIVKWAGGSGAAEIWRRLKMPNAPATWMLKKFRGGKRVEESADYPEILNRIVQSGKVQESASALAEFPTSRQLPTGADPEEIALLGTLSYITEPERNPGTLVNSVLQAEMYGKVAGEQGKAKQQTDFVNTFNLTPMAFVGSATAGRGEAGLASFLASPRALENRIAELEKLERAGKLSKTQKENLPTLRNALRLGNNEAKLLEEWFKAIHSIDTTESRQVVMTRFCDSIVARLHSVFIWWNPSSTIKRPV
jgi:hypothetical protein